MRPLPDGRRGKRFRFAYRMAGLRLEGESETLECAPCRRNVSRQRGAIDRTIVWTFESDGEGVQVTFDGEYKMAVPLVGALIERLVVRKRAVERLRANLKARLESSN